ncbi:adenylyl-sulfate kinase [Candidatus Desantisbacteria bacterium]|nr:adenylyl-sulfate kinase [Candidatus Desantisbacteria bacterium]
MNIKKKSTIIKKRKILSCQKGLLLWFTGLQGAGKSTLAHRLEIELHNKGYLTTIINENNLKNLGLTTEFNTENIKKIGEIAKLFVDREIITISTFISPYKNDREKIRNLFKNSDFMEIYVKCSFEILKSREEKGLFKKINTNEFYNFSARYEEPVNPEITLNTSILTIEECLKILLIYLEKKGVE